MSTNNKVEVFKKAIGHDGKEQELAIHIYLPKDWKPTDKRPAVLFWHGGGFTGGGPEQFFAQAEYFAGRGMVAASAAYRLNMGGPTGVKDGRSAVRWFKKHAGELGFDPAKLVVGGGSAGGHIAFAVATNVGLDDKADDLSIPLTVVALLGFNPGLGRHSDLTAKPSNPGSPARAFFECSEPIAKLRKGAPPAIMFYGTEDSLMEGGKAFCEKSIALGTLNELWTAEGMDHAFFNSAPWKQLTLQKADEFLVSLGLLGGKPTIEIPPGTTVKLEKALPAT